MMSRVWVGISICACAIVLAMFPVRASAQGATATLKVEVKSGAGPVASAEVVIGAVKASTDAAGQATLTVPAGTLRVEIRSEGFAAQTREVTAAAGATVTLSIELAPDVDADEEITVSATRSGKRLQDEPMRVEVLDREEIEEKLMMTPGDIAMMLNETAGLRVQVTSPSLGAASLRMHGLRGRYTQILSDGLPLYGGQSGSFGLLQIPPMDLGRVEVIKGAASSLFGSSALGGVVNLVSRQPKDHAEREVLVNQTTLGGTDGVMWLSGPLNERWGYSVLGNVDRQSQKDIDKDGWTDVAGFTRFNLRPRMSWNNGEGRSVLATVGVMAEDRVGGVMPSRTAPDGRPFRESIDSRRIDAGLVGRFLLDGARVLGVRGSATMQFHEHVFGDTEQSDKHSTAFSEVSLTGTTGAHTWVIGGALQQDAYRITELPKFNYTYWVPSLFAQDDITFSPKVSMSVSGRFDHHNTFGNFFSPRVSLLVRPDAAWTMRASAGTGYFAPTPLTDETDAAGLARLASALPTKPERAQTYSVDIGRTFAALELNATVFGSHLTDALAATRQSANTYALVTLTEPTRTVGAEGMAKLHVNNFAVVATYTYTRATEIDPAGRTRSDVELTPRHTAGLVGMWEKEDIGRAGIEMYYTGKQRLEDNPFRSESPSYLYVGAMIERHIGERLRVFVNAENLFDRRQTRYDSLVRPTRNYDGRWTVNAWGPLDGRVFNAGVRWMF